MTKKYIYTEDDLIRDMSKYGYSKNQMQETGKVVFPNRINTLTPRKFPKR